MSDDVFGSFSDEELEAYVNDDKINNPYVSDPEKGLKLISLLLPSNDSYSTSTKEYWSLANVKSILKYKIWDTQRHVGVDLRASESLIEKLSSQLAESKKINLLKGKSIIGMGGKFSAGKSGFINSLLNLKKDEFLLKEDQNPTTSIPTYLTYGRNQKINAYCGMRVVPLDLSMMQAITYGFFRKYNIGFSRYINNIAIHTKTFPRELRDKVVLLDTPGYNNSKEDNTSSLTDRDIALSQLKVADFIVWLADINNGTITNNDLEFIRELDSSIPILFVFTKADQKVEEGIAKTVQDSEDLLKDMGVNVFGVTAYSSLERKEYLGRNLIQDFLANAVNNTSHRNDPEIQIDMLIEDLYRNLLSRKDRLILERKDVGRIISDSRDIVSLRLMSNIYSSTCRSLGATTGNIYRFYSLLEGLKADLNNLNLFSNCREIQKILNNKNSGARK